MGWGNQGTLCRGECCEVEGKGEGCAIPQDHFPISQSIKGWLIVSSEDSSSERELNVGTVQVKAADSTGGMDGVRNKTRVLRWHHKKLVSLWDVG